MEVRQLKLLSDSSDECTQMPTFFFQINKMRQHPQLPPRHTAGGYWVPPKVLRGNVPVNGDTTGQFFFFNGAMTRPLESNLPNGLAHYRTFSVYYDDPGESFWIVDYNALQQQVGDGSQDDLSGASESDEDEDEDDNWGIDWAQLCFLPGTGEQQHDYTSYVTCAGENHRLFLQKETQTWARKLFPARYHAPPDRTISANQADQYPDWGGLIGDLPLLIALIAFSVRENEVGTAVQHCLYGNPWQMHTLSRRRGCM